MSSNKTDVINYDEETQAEEYGTGELEKIKGVVANQKTNMAITENDSDWLAGKVKGDKKAADRFAKKFWSEEQTEKLKNQINNSEVSPFERVFHPRIYEPFDSEALKAVAENREVIVTDDIFTTGGSAAAIIRILDRMGIPVKAVAGYFGDTRLSVPPQIISSMHKALKNAGISVKARKLAKHLTFTEAKIITEFINKAGSEDEKAKLSRKLQGICDR